MAFISIFMLLSFIFLSSTVSSNPIQICEALQSNCHGRLIAEAEKFTVRYRQCLLEQLEDNKTEMWNNIQQSLEQRVENYTDIWNMMPVAIETCLGREKFSKYLNIVQIGGPEPRKLIKPVILPPSINSSCTIVFVRRDFICYHNDPQGDPPRHSNAAEKQFINRFPQCDLHTVEMEPDPSNPRGKFYDFRLVGRDSPETTMSWPDDQAGNVTSLLEKVIKVPRVDYLWIEVVARFEDWLMTPMKNNDKKWYVAPHPLNYPDYLFMQETINVTVCQVHLVTQLFAYHYGHDSMLLARPLLPALITSVISNSSFLPFRSRFDNETGELHTFYFNISDSYCLKKYLAPMFCAEYECPENIDIVIDTKIVFT